MNKHTPKPWRLGTKDANDQRQVLGPEGQLVAVCAHECITSREPEMELNAHLITSAPELLHALRVIVQGATQTQGQDSCGWDYAYVRQAMLDVGRAAIAKAQGREP